jgi:hypothetical protein
LDTIGCFPGRKNWRSSRKDSLIRQTGRNSSASFGRKMDYAVHWLSFLERRPPQRLQRHGYIDGGRKQITSWLFFRALQQQTVQRIRCRINQSTAESEGFAKESFGAVWSTRARPRRCRRRKISRRFSWA